MSVCRLGFALTGSFCTFEKVMACMEQLQETGDYAIFPIFSFHAAQLDTRFGKASHWLERAEEISGHKPILTLQGAEPSVPKRPWIFCSSPLPPGNTLGKLAWGITDTPVLLAAKAHLRNQRPVVIAVSTNDALASAGKNIGLLCNAKNLYFVPMGQDDSQSKPCSIVADFSLVEPALKGAAAGVQLQPMMLSPR